jgi:mycothiol synthase
VVDGDGERIEGTGVRATVEPGEHGPGVGLLGELDDASAPTIDAVTAWVTERVGVAAPAQLVSDHPVERDHPLPAAVAARLGLHPRRELLQLRRPLPADPPPPGLALRPFLPERDADAWVRANNRAFATHPSQGAQTSETLAATLAEPWVDLDGFLMADDPDRPGELAGSCWTRVHPGTGTDPEVGEIFVIGVDPHHHGRGLGRRLVLAGLDHLARQGLEVGMLWVEHDNLPARALYERLGFSPHHRRRLHLP